ncbi:MAG: hypothetical protein HUJ65_00895, partial [Oscillospiraceae bacterium]|nr:hypothetical protein [Oscillospiraceae bacterium]
LIVALIVVVAMLVLMLTTGTPKKDKTDNKTPAADSSETNAPQDKDPDTKPEIIPEEPETSPEVKPSADDKKPEDEAPIEDKDPDTKPEIIPEEPETSPEPQPDEPEPSPEPEVPVYVLSSGSFEGKTETGLTLVVEYSVAEVGGVPKLGMKAFLRCWSLDIGERTVVFDVNGKSHTLTAPEYSSEEEELVYIPYGETYFELSGSGAYDVSVTIPGLNISYSGKELTSVAAQARIVVE